MMENKETPRGNQWDQDRRDKEPLDQQQPLEGPLADDAQPIDLDGDGMIGNTGGFYGGTSYVGSNYGADWNSEDNSRHEGNYGAAGQKDDSPRIPPRQEDERNPAPEDEM